VTGVGFEPEHAWGSQARERLERDGAVIVAGYALGPDGLVRAAADLLGARLRQLFPARALRAEHSDQVALHNDSFNIVVDIHGRATQLRDPDEDYVLIQCVQRAHSGGESLLADGYLLLDRLRDHQPQLWDFLTNADVDFYGSWGDQPAVPRTPCVCRHHEYTRGGRRIVRANQGAQPMPREPHWAEHERMLDLYADIRATLAVSAPRVPLDSGDILVVDNYRCWHGRDAHHTPRSIYVQTVKTVDAM
jgi:gamma-butyrobetaine dioxygenase